MISGFVTFYAVYGTVLLVATLVSLFTRGWTRNVIIALVLAWLPFLAMSLLLILSISEMVYGGSMLRGSAIALLIAAPSLLIVAVFLLVWKWMQRFRE
jgi:hypothetical protein